MRRSVIAVMALALFIVGGGLQETQAQTFFYQEVVKDGRIYVFADATNFKNFSESGDMGKSLTRIGAGPSGETMVFDSESAINLYNFKHGKPGEVLIPTPAVTPKMAVSWKDGKTTIETDNAMLQISNRVQVRYTYSRPEDEAKPGNSAFRIRRAKTKFEGWFYKPWMQYKVQFNFADTANTLEDAWLNVDVTKGKKLFQVEAGQFKQPFGREAFTSSGELEFGDRSLATNAFTPAYQTGVMLWGLTPNQQWEWRLTADNGNGRNQSGNDNPRLEWNARLQYSPFGEVKYSQADLDNSQRPLLALGIGYNDNSFFDKVADKTKNFDIKTQSFDATFKYKGLYLFGEYFDRTSTPQAPGDDIKARGFTAQAGYFFIPQKWEVVARVSEVDPNRSTEKNTQTEKQFGISYYFNKHAFKVQNYVRYLKDESKASEKDTDREFVSQLQFIF